MSLADKRILLIIAGGIAAYKSLDLIRRLRDKRAFVRVVMTANAQRFITPLAAAALSGERVHTDLFDPQDEAKVGHIRLARDTDLVIVAPATADLMARMATGQADDLASSVLLATSAPILLAPAMNPHMWHHPATRRNLATLKIDGVLTVGPNDGAMAEAEFGTGRMSEPLEILAAADNLLQRPKSGLLSGLRILVTSGPTFEPVDPVRFLGNRSSGKQGHAIARAAAAAGASVTLVSGPVALPDPEGVKTLHVETAGEMRSAVEQALPADIAIFAAAVADWRVANPSGKKMKKEKDRIPDLRLVENPDILMEISRHPAQRPRLVVGFAAETQDILAHAREKLARKGCDVLLANDVSSKGAGSVFGGDCNTIHLIDSKKEETWPTMSKDEVAQRLMAYLAQRMGGFSQ